VNGARIAALHQQRQAMLTLIWIAGFERFVCALTNCPRTSSLFAAAPKDIAAESAPLAGIKK